MSLTRRVSVFFLGALAIVLVGFSTTLFLMARTYLLRQADARLDAVLTTLEACAEEDDEGLEWEPTRRPIAVGLSNDPSEPRWIIQAEDGTLVDRSRNFSPAEAGPEPFQGRRWKVARRRMIAKKIEEPDEGYTKLVLISAIDLRPTWRALGLLAAVLSGLSTAVWILAAVLGTRFCRVALRPLTRMASSARSMGANDLDRRLPVSATGDELEDLGRSFNDLLDRLQEAFERQRRFGGDASHQLRTPLTALIGQIEVCLRRPRPAEEYRAVLQLAREQAAQMSRIVEALLFLARADADAPLPGIAPLDLVAWTDRHLRDHWRDQPRAIDFVRETGGIESIPVLAHPPLLAQLFDNLLDNACKYSPNGRPIVVRTGLKSLEGRKAAVLEVEDRGPGIAEDDLAQIFEPFYRSERVRLQGRSGVGLGLAVASRIARAFGGGLSVTNREGARFTLELPFRDSTLTPPDPALHCAGVDSFDLATTTLSVARSASNEAN